MEFDANKIQYQPPHPQDWLSSDRDSSGGAEYLSHYVQQVDLRTEQPYPTTHSTYLLIGFDEDEQSASRIIKRKLAELAIAKELTSPIIDVGNIKTIDSDLLSAQQTLGELIASIITQGFTPIVIGSGKESIWGHYQGIAQTERRNPLGIINMGSYLGLSAQINFPNESPFMDIATSRRQQQLPFDCLNIGMQPLTNPASYSSLAHNLSVEIISADDVQESFKAKRQLDRFLKRHSQVYLSLSLDLFNEATAPAVHSPQPLGLSVQQVLPLLSQICQHSGIVAIDVTNLDPTMDGKHQTARLAAHLIGHMIGHMVGGT